MQAIYDQREIDERNKHDIECFKPREEDPLSQRNSRSISLCRLYMTRSYSHGVRRLCLGGTTRTTVNPSPVAASYRLTYALEHFFSGIYAILRGLASIPLLVEIPKRPRCSPHAMQVPSTRSAFPVLTCSAARNCGRWRWHLICRRRGSMRLSHWSLSAVFGPTCVSDLPCQ